MEAFRPSSWRSSNSLIGVVYLVAFLDLFSASMTTTILSSYLKDSVGLSATLAGIIGSVYGVVQFFSSPVIGGLCDLKGYRYGLILTLVSCVPSYALLMADFWVFLAAARLLAGFFKQTQNLCRTFVASFLADETQKVAVFGRLNAMGNVGFIVGPALAGFLTQNLGYGSVFLTTALIFGLNSLIVWKFFPNKVLSQGSPVSVEENLDKNANLRPTKSGSSLAGLISQIEWKSQWDLLAVRLLLSFTVLLYRNSFNWYTSEKFRISPATIGYLTSYQGCVAFLASYYASHFLRYYSDNVKALGHVILLLALSLVSLWLAPSLWVYGAFLAPFTFGTSIMRVVSLELTTERCHKRDVGFLIGAGMSAVSVSRAVTPAIGGYLHDLNPEFPTVFGIGIALATWYLTITVTRRNQRLFALNKDARGQEKPKEMVH